MPFLSPLVLRLLQVLLALTGTGATALAVVTTVGPHAPSFAQHVPVASAPGQAGAGSGAAPARGAGSASAGGGGTTAVSPSEAAATAVVAGSPTAASGTGVAPGTSVAAGRAGGSAPLRGGLMWIGSVAGGYQQALAGTGVPLADHTYSFFSGTVPQAQMLTVSAGNTPWHTVATAGPGSALYDQIVSWAQTIKARGGSIMVAYNHEPEGHDRLTLGSPADFIAAYRHVEMVFDQQGATNVVWTWQMTAYAFQTKPGSPQYAADWYPGDDYVDVVGADAYNWNTCGQGNGRYNELQAIGDPMLAFARAHHKLASFPEFASDATGNRAQWLANAHQYFIANQDVLTAAFYFNRPPTIAANSDCHWGLTSAAEYAALRAMAQDTAHFAV